MAAVFLRRLSAFFALLIAVSVLGVGGAASPALADPDEGGTKTLRDALESAAKGQADAIQKLNASKKRQVQLQATVKNATASAKALESQVGQIANRSYRLGRTSTVTLLLNSTSPDSFLQRIQQIDMLGQIDGQILQQYRDDVARAQAAKAAVDREIVEQQKQVAALTKKKKEAELALGSVGGGGAAGGFVSANSPLAKPAPRNSDGSWPKESCTVDDPTTSGCITPRLLNAYQQARAAGFTHYTSCWSQRSSGEHPKGRACDFSANKSGFQNVAASGADKTYGNNLAAFFVKNADRLGVMYVIWYRQIWMPGTGWKAYSKSGGPSEVHTNHVHLSIL
ncbi:coiled-coil domain-containing protein [Actinoplanes sp. CA-030573]|uniref:coiled-coil domain-containing protein n=1 Tax=Actinoplanes sp. CA-030573 TaxID=3239898 RepID=UPI003D9387A5